MNIPNHNCCHVCRNVSSCEQCLLIEALALEVDDKQMTDQPPETEKRVLVDTRESVLRRNCSVQLRASLLNTTS